MAHLSAEVATSIAFGTIMLFLGILTVLQGHKHGTSHGRYCWWLLTLETCTLTLEVVDEESILPREYRTSPLRRGPPSFLEYPRPIRSKCAFENMYPLWSLRANDAASKEKQFLCS